MISYNQTSAVVALLWLPTISFAFSSSASASLGRSTTTRFSTGSLHHQHNNQYYSRLSVLYLTASSIIAEPTSSLPNSSSVAGNETTTTTTTTTTSEAKTAHREKEARGQNGMLRFSLPKFLFFKNGAGSSSSSSKSMVKESASSFPVSIAAKSGNYTSPYDSNSTDLTDPSVIEKNGKSAINETAIWDQFLSNSKKKSSPSEKRVNSTKHFTSTYKKKKDPPKPLISTLSKDKLITLADLESILTKNEFVRRKELGDTIKASADAAESKKKNKEVALPQPSALTNKAVTFGTTISAGVLCMFLGLTVFPRLWLVGAVVGTNIGHRVATTSIESPGKKMNLFSKLTLKLGKRVAKYYLLVYDFCQSMWFLYKTGQLSYDYMKRYQNIDNKYQIQEKIDAWNARFKEGKENFDEWEKENEVGRKILAGLRTVWLVEEKSLKKVSRKMKGTSKYRLVEYAKRVSKWFGSLAYAIWDAVTGGGLSELRVILSGVRTNIEEMNWESSARMVGSGLMAFFAVNLVVALFEIVPTTTGFTAFIVGAIWPEWVRESYTGIRDILSGAAAKNRVEKEKRQKEAKINASTTRKSSTSDVSGVHSWFSQFIECPKKEERENIRTRGKKKSLLRIQLPEFRRKPQRKPVWGGNYSRQNDR